MLFTLTMSAFALDCTDPSVDTDTCDTVTNLIVDINTAYGGPDVVSDAAPSRLTPDAVYAAANDARLLFDSVGCGTPIPAFFAGGTYRNECG